MAYRIEGRDIVISGFEKGISDSPYNGIADMRNVEIITVPGEASVEFSQVAVQVPAVVNAAAYTASASADTLTWTGTPALYAGTAITLASNTAMGLSNGVVYYVGNIVGSTFQVFITPLLLSHIDITGNGTGTFTTYQYGNQRGIGGPSPTSYFVDQSGSYQGLNTVYLVDASNYVWVIVPVSINSIPLNSLLFLGNIGGNGAGASSQSGIAIWNEYIILFGATGVGEDYANAATLLTSGPAAEWVYGWQDMGTHESEGRIDVLVSQEDGNLYWTSDTGLGSLVLEIDEVTHLPKTFDPTDTTTYDITSTAILLPATDSAICIAELGTSILVGGDGSFLYVWDKLSLGFNSLINIPDIFIRNIVATSQNAYVFAGVRGRIYITNGSGIDLYKKVPDYVTGIVNPYIIWEDASFAKNQLYFSFYATDNAGNMLTTVAGAWVVDLDTDSMRLQNKTTKSDYAGFTTMVTLLPFRGYGNNPVGTGAFVGWYSGTTYGLDIGSSNPYTNYESYLETDIIPVGTFLDPFSPSQVEWKTSAPLVAGESVRISYRPSLSTAFSPITDATHSTGESAVVGSTSDMIQANFQKVQWVQLKVELKSTNTTPSFTRLTEARIRDYPSGSQSEGTYPVKI